MVGHLALADEVLGTGDLIREDGRDQVFRAHPRELRRHLLAAAEPRQRERDAGNPSPARDEHRRIEHGLDEDWPHGRRMQVARDLSQLKAVRRRQRQHDVVLGRRCLQLKIELSAEALAQCEAPRAVDAAAERRVDDELHAAGFIEEPLEHDLVLRRQGAKRRVARAQVVDDLSGGRLGETEPIDQPAQGARSGRVGLQTARDLGPKSRDGGGQLIAPAWRLAQPERQGRRRAMGVLDADDAALDAQDAIGGIAELEDVACRALDGEVFIDGADDLRLRFEQHLVVGIIGDRAAGRQRGQT